MHLIFIIKLLYRVKSKSNQYSTLKKKLSLHPVSIDRIYHLVLKEASLEWRNKSLLASMLIYVLGAAFIVYYAFQGDLDYDTFAAVYWIIVLFASVNILGKTFDKEVRQQYYYLRSVVRPLELVLSKMIYNSLLVFVFELIIFLEMTLFFNVEIERPYLFYMTLLLGGIGFSNLFTLFSTITSRTGNIVLLSVLGFPIILPLLLLILRLTVLADLDVSIDDSMLNIGAITVLDLITLVLSLILFPYLWNE